MKIDWFNLSCAVSSYTGPIHLQSTVLSPSGASPTTPSGISFWLQDVCEDVAPTVDSFEPSPDFEVGDWKLDVEARGWGENTIGTFQDNFIIVITVHRVCQQYPIEPPCDE